MLIDLIAPILIVRRDKMMSILPVLGEDPVIIDKSGHGDWGKSLLGGL
jgi:hypothetical protein